MKWSVKSTRPRERDRSEPDDGADSASVLAATADSAGAAVAAALTKSWRLSRPLACTMMRAKKSLSAVSLTSMVKGLPSPLHGETT